LKTNLSRRRTFAKEEKSPLNREDLCEMRGEEEDFCHGGGFL
jgi:hypothetical protein